MASTDKADKRKSNIFCGIVTYNPDIDRLRDNIAAVSPQVDEVLIFDNHSNNLGDIETLISCYPATLTRWDKNSGMAVALNRLANSAIEAGATDILFLDQDSVVGQGTVAGLAEYRSPEIGIVTPLIVDRNNTKIEPDLEMIYEIKRPITSGSLVNLEAWKAVGGYDERLFVDWVDDEFCDNLRAHGYKLIRVNGVSLLHELGNQEYAWSAPGKDYTNVRRTSRAYYKQNYPLWRWEDRGRSESITIKKYGWSRIGLEERLIFIKSTLGRAIFIEDNSIEILKSILRGYRDASNEKNH
jgi:rhamnosyltransferase